MSDKTCRFCRSPLKHTFVDLGVSPLANSFIKENQLSKMEPFYPLHTYVCDQCFLVQLEEFESPEHIFKDYAYFSSFSDSWLDHAKNYVNSVIDKFKLGPHSKVIEIASNDGYLLQYFKEKNIPVLGVEPAENVALKAMEKGIPTRTEFFGKVFARQLVVEGLKGDLIIANNVLAHVPDLHDFVGGMKQLMHPLGVITVEFPHILNLICQNQFDTIYHEHFSYFSLLTFQEIFKAHNLEVFDVEEIPTHGGSLRIFAKHEEDRSKVIHSNIGKLIEKEKSLSLHRLDTYQKFYDLVKQTKVKILEFFIQAKKSGKTIVGYGAPAKGNTLLNYCGIGKELLPYTVDRNPFKQGLYLPGTHIPVKAPDMISETKPDYVFILPWNLKEEIMDQMSFIREWGGQFVVAIPEIEVL
ncbi:methyltransferase domain-containing protein [Neobacillus sp. GCM10023253]|uniref:methyltransferase domain-containing protein n=1 Tax=Neobacillus sp. GCM10023253 TaxID=3252644 RepID=UPI00360EC1D7